MSVPPLDASLATFSENDASVKLVWAVFSVIPGAPALSFYGSMGEAQMLAYPDLPPGGLERAAGCAAEAGALRALDVADFIDKGDIGIAALSGAAAMFRLFFGDKTKALDTDPQQGADAALKALALAFLVHQLIPGSIPEKVATLRGTQAGEALLTWYAAVEIALPFADDAALGAGSVVGHMIDKYGTGHLSKLDMLGGSGAGANAQTMLGALAGPLDNIIVNVSRYTQQIADAAKQYLPTAIATAGTVAGAVATAADALPVYRLLVARLVTEISLSRCTGAST
ncbi:MAG: hypothetical protein EXR69_02765 [Myxococcales bacterium]|nr:hypothetical protein [Myxococcales bacterium]